MKVGGREVLWSTPLPLGSFRARAPQGQMCTPFLLKCRSDQLPWKDGGVGTPAGLAWAPGMLPWELQPRNSSLSWRSGGNSYKSVKAWF